MKKLLILLFIPAFLIACNGQQINWGGLIPPEQSVCAQEGYEDSWICEATAKANLTPEDLSGIILDATALTIIVSDMTSDDLAEVRGFIDMVDQYLDIHLMTWHTLLGLIEEDSAKVSALALILNRRLPIFESQDVIQQIDIDMIRYHLDEMRKLLPVI